MMFARLVEVVLNFLFVRYEIGRHGAGTYLVRWDVLRNRYGTGLFAHCGKLFVHCFCRSDDDGALHDHPFDFWSLILWGGYHEHAEGTVRWYGPLRLLRRPAEWAHRVELPPGKKCWTLVWTSPKRRSWYFHCPKGMVEWREYLARQEKKGAGCE